ncbi:ABC-type multidrug transport system fused ATPase/permease subunit [Balneicella halophila]|uniref:ABC-type multidrug transport system fused ATPase/permease subunit n=1 Tax=Balneicella halophila TaxID=1537566 RepID=A0A7L4US74_BALHA|nr:ABC transporter ATP-binding protein [Balneicella halophila]PVX52636.1 ABC-type multidrug transport system fused ATPase/permease subunit [Balneicella halophila]
MKEFIQILRRFLPPYKKNLLLNVIFNIISAVATSFSFAILIPVLNILFESDKDITSIGEFQMDFDYIKEVLGYYTTQIKYEYGIENTLLIVGSFYIIATLVKVGTQYLASYNMIFIRNSVVRDVRNQIYTKVVDLPLSFFSEERKGDVMARITGDVTEVENSIMNSLDMLFKNPIMIIVLLGSMLFMSWQLTIFVLILLPISGFIIGRIGKNLKKRSGEGQSKMGEILSTTEETLSGHRIIKAFNAEDKMKVNFDEQNNSYRITMNRLQRRYALAHPMSELLGSVTIIILLWYGGRLILGDSGFQASVFIAYLGIFYSIINPAKALSQASYSIQKGLAAMDRIDMILTAENTIKEAEDAIEIHDFTDNIRYSNVTFTYDNKVDVLRNIYVDIEKGQTVALVGQSGSGKTTFADLLPRFYDVAGGRITVDGIDIRKAKLKSLRALMGNVNQDPILFNDTFFNNIAFGVENATQEEVERAAKIANAHDFIMATAKGYQTNVGDRGGKLSGGQRQRISIARAVLKNPPIMILDEATSALDTQSEKYVQEALDNLMKDRTSIVIAHRLSTIRNADLILVFKDGQIVERGKHDELLAKSGAYSVLHEMQTNNKI